MRKRAIIGNWKMNKGPIEAVEWAEQLVEIVNTDEVDVIICPPFVNLMAVAEVIKDTDIKLGSQTMHFDDFGPYTGEVSPTMLEEIGVKYAIIGHSERRRLFNETDETVNKKIFKAIEHEISPIVCVGESLEQRQNGIVIEHIRSQIKRAFKNVSFEDAQKTMIAYEPIWAIGTGMTATPQQAQEVCSSIRQVLAELYDKEIAEEIRILYGGSVTGRNAADIFAMKDIDGGLVGGASLKMDFEKIVEAK